MKKINLKNGMTAVVKVNPDTPKVALNLYVQIAEPEKKAGIYVLLNRLFWQGTKRFGSKQLAEVLEENAIECFSESKQDYFKFKLVCLNEDFELGLEILADVLENSTFELFEKEVVKLRGEIEAELDSPKMKALDTYYRTFFREHYYGDTYTKIREQLDSLTQQDVLDAYESIFKKSKKVVCVVGDLDFDTVEADLMKYLGNVSSCNDVVSVIEEPVLDERRVALVVQDDAEQAQIIMGWMVGTYNSEDYVPTVLMNNILGSGGLSSRLFLELREKKGLAYVVRSSYESYMKAAGFSVYIATEPRNIETCLQGFKAEMEKIKTILVSDEELSDAKNNLIGKRQFILETNSQQSAVAGFYEFTGLGYEYESELIESIKKVTSEDIMRVANRYFNDNYVLTILAKSEALKGFNETN